MKFRIDLKIFAFLILFYFTRQIEIYALIMLFAIIHELSHLVEANHSSRFWSLVEENYPDYKKVRKEMKLF